MNVTPKYFHRRVEEKREPKGISCSILSLLLVFNQKIEVFWQRLLLGRQLTQRKIAPARRVKVDLARSLVPSVVQATLTVSLVSYKVWFGLPDCIQGL